MKSWNLPTLTLQCWGKTKLGISKGRAALLSGRAAFLPSRSFRRTTIMLKISAIGNLTNDIELKKVKRQASLMSSCGSLRTGSTGIRMAIRSPTLSPSRPMAVWPSAAWTLPGRAAVWRRLGILRRSPPRRRQSSQVSSSGHATWNSCRPGNTRQSRKERSRSDLGDEK